MTVEKQLAENGSYMTVTRGNSMWPLFRTDRDAVVIEAPKRPIRRFDIVLYRVGERHILHRVLHVREGFFLIRGDNTFVTEHIPSEDILGVVTFFVRKGKKISVTDFRYRLYVAFWWAIFPLRFFLWKLRCLLGKAYRLFFRKKGASTR